MRSKLGRFEEIKHRDNVFDPVNEGYEKIKGNWHTDYFKNDHNIVLELGCGRGEYTLGMSRMFPDQNFIGVDIKGDRIYIGSGIALEEKLANVGFLRTDIRLMDKFFMQSEIADIWITFPDPRPKDRDIKKRLTSPKFLDIYKGLIKKDGIVRLKTDNTDLFNYTLEVLEERNDITNLRFTHDLYQDELHSECYDIKTRFEEKFHEKGEDIKYLRFNFKS